MKEIRKPQKKKDRSTQSVQKWTGYYMEDMDCKLCLHYQGKKKGCELPECCCLEDKKEATAKGRIKRIRKIGKWDM